MKTAALTAAMLVIVALQSGCHAGGGNTGTTQAIEQEMRRLIDTSKVLQRMQANIIRT